MNSKLQKTVKTAIARLAATAVFLSPAMAFAGMGISTGSPSGTYYAVAQDLQRVCKGVVDIKIYESAGSLSNLERIFSDPNVQYGIVQEDALLYKQLTDPELMAKIRVVAPFFREEIVVVAGANSGINSLQDLAGKRVVMGVPGSGNSVAAQLIAAKTGLDKSIKAIEASPKDGLDMLANGQADAVFVVGGKPFPLLQNLGSFANGRVKIVPLSSPALDGFYRKAMIPEGIYAWQKTAVQTYAVQSVLATFDYKSPTMQKDIGNLVKCMQEKLPELQEKGHPKWREVDLSDLKRVNWPVHPAALRALGQAPEKAATKKK